MLPDLGDFESESGPTNQEVRYYMEEEILELHRAIQIWERKTQDLKEVAGNKIIITTCGKLHSGFCTRRLLIPAIGQMLDLRLDTVYCLEEKVRLNSTIYVPSKYPVAII